jgi:hypothetical protein
LHSPRIRHQQMVYLQETLHPFCRKCC